MENVVQVSCNNRSPEFGGRRRRFGRWTILLAIVLGGTHVLFAQHSQDSTTTQEQSKSARLGAQHGSRPVLPGHSEAVSIELPKSAGDVRDVLANAMSQVQSRNMAVKIANSLAYISTSLLRAIEVADLERRLAALEGERSRIEDD